MRAALKLGLGKLFGLFACVTILLAIASDARAILVAYEGFDYAANSPLLGLIGGTGWDLQPGDPNFGFAPGGWDGVQAAIGADVIQADSLTYTDSLGNMLQTTGGKLLNTGSSGVSSQGGRFLAERRSTGSTWLSFLSQRTGTLSANGTYPRGANLSLFDLFRGNNTERLNIGPENSSNAWLNPDTTLPEDRFQLRYPAVPFGILNTNLPPENQPPTPNNNTATGAANRYRDAFTEVSTHVVNLFVMRIDHVPGADDNVYVWLNPDLSSTPLDADVSARYLDAEIRAAAAAAMPTPIDPYGPAASLNDGDQSFDRIRFFAANGNATDPFADLLIDELRVGTMFADVTPFIPGGTPADYNGDDVVNAADYTTWRNHLGETFQLDNEGDGITPGTVTSEDYDFWKQHFGEPGAGSGGVGASGVPEPSTLVLLAVGASLAAMGRRRRDR